MCRGLTHLAEQDLELVQITVNRFPVDTNTIPVLKNDRYVTVITDGTSHVVQCGIDVRPGLLRTEVLPQRISQCIAGG
ncbi:hypothetical protein D3C74_327790 [compost metagenome]